MLLLCQYSLPVTSITPVLEGLAKDGVILNRLQIIKTGLIFTAYKRSDEFVFFIWNKILSSHDEICSGSTPSQNALHREQL